MNGRLDLDSLRFRLARDARDLQAAMQCRWRGFGPKYGFRQPEELWDSTDETACHYLCEDAASGAVLGALRMCSAINGQLEAPAGSLQRWLARHPCTAEITRLSVPLTPRSPAVKLGLWKLVWLHCLQTGHTHAVTYVRKGALRDYRFLGFAESPLLPPPFAHQRLAGSAHYVLAADFTRLADDARAQGHPLYGIMCEERHQGIVQLPEPGA